MKIRDSINMNIAYFFQNISYFRNLYNRLECNKIYKFYMLYHAHGRGFATAYFIIMIQGVPRCDVG